MNPRRFSQVLKSKPPTLLLLVVQVQGLVTPVRSLLLMLQEFSRS